MLDVAAYATELEGLVPELVTLLSAWIPRLRAAFGPWRARQIPDVLGDPDGYSGLARRGPWDRLALSEWALADALPDEFVRRVVMGEQLFVELSRISPSSTPHTVAYVDCGPEQLGAPRLAQLAVLMVLHRRALEAGGTFRWAPLHHPDRLSEHPSAQALFDHRSLQVGLNAPEEDGEVFVVAPHGSVQITEVDGGLEVEVRGRRVRLELPSIRNVARYISSPERKPFRPARRELAGDLDEVRFSPSGSTLWIRQGQAVRAFAVPDRPRVRSKIRRSDPEYGEPKGPLVGTGWYRRTLMTVRVEEGGLVLRYADRIRRMDLPDGLAPAGLSPIHVLPAIHLPEESPGSRVRYLVLLADGAHVLWALDFTRNASERLGTCAGGPCLSDGVYSWLDLDGRAMRLTPGGVGAFPGAEDFSLREFHHFAPSLLGESRGDLPFDAVLPCIRRHTPCHFALARDGQWAFVRLGGWARFTEPDWFVGPSHADAAWASSFREPGETPRLFEIQGTELIEHTRSGSRLLFACAHPIERVVVGGSKRPVIAAVLANSTIEMRSLEGELWLELAP